MSKATLHADIMYAHVMLYRNILHHF